MGMTTRILKGAGRAVLAADKKLANSDKRWGAKDFSTLEPVKPVVGKPMKGGIGRKKH